MPYRQRRLDDAERRECSGDNANDDDDDDAPGTTMSATMTTHERVGDATVIASIFGEKRPILCVTEENTKKSNPHFETWTPRIGLVRDLSIFQIRESQNRFGVHSNLGTNINIPRGPSARTSTCSTGMIFLPSVARFSFSSIIPVLWLPPMVAALLPSSLVPL